MCSTGVKNQNFKSLKDDLTNSGCTPHYMIELSKVEMLTMKRNMITASGMRRDTKGILNYTTLDHGTNLELKGNTSTSLLKSDTKHYQFNISRVSKQCLLICTKKSECMLHYPNVRIIDSSYAIGKVCNTEKSMNHQVWL